MGSTLAIVSRDSERTGRACIPNPGQPSDAGAHVTAGSMLRLLTQQHPWGPQADRARGGSLRDLGYAAALGGTLMHLWSPPVFPGGPGEATDRCQLWAERARLRLEKLSPGPPFSLAVTSHGEPQNSRAEAALGALPLKAWARHRANCGQSCPHQPLCGHCRSLGCQTGQQR